MGSIIPTMNLKSGQKGDAKLIAISSKAVLTITIFHLLGCI